MTPRVSIIVVTYNAEKDIRNFLDSLFQNTPENDWELVLVENKSQDKTLEIIEKYLEIAEENKLSKIQLIKSQKNLGYGGGKNLGAKTAKGEILIFLNPDTLLGADWLAPIIAKFDSDEKTGIIGPKILYGDRETIQSAGGWVERAGFAHHYGYGEKDTGQWNTEKEVDYVTGACLAVRKKLFDQCLGFDENYFPAYYEETELCYKIKKLGFQVLYLPASSIVHLESQSTGLFSYNYYFWFHKHRWRYILKNLPMSEIFCSALPFEVKWLWGNFAKKTKKRPPHEKDAAEPNQGKSPELKALKKAYFSTFLKLPNIIFYRYFKYYVK